MATLEQWVAREHRYAASAMLQSLSRVDLVKERPGFGQTVRPARGALVASPVLAAYDPEPDYFFHWFRDSALVMDALRVLFADGSVGPEALAHFGDFVRFSASLCALDGRRLVAAAAWRDGVAADHARFVRDDAELASIHGGAVAGEARVNPDGTLDISRWARPQHDGPALRALTLLRWLHAAPLDPGLAAETAALLRDDLEFAFRHWREPSFDLWEEYDGPSYYTLRVTAAALSAGAAWLEANHAAATATAYRAEAAIILRRLDDFWVEASGYYRSRLSTPEARAPGGLDIAVILAVLHAGEGESGGHSVDDPRMQRTLDRLAAEFAASYPINRDRSPMAPAMGRYAGDAYYSGGPWYLATLGAAEFCYRASRGAREARGWIERGDAFLATVRAFTPRGGELSEQFDPLTGAQVSARHLAWSYAAFISCSAARRECAREPLRRREVASVSGPWPTRGEER